MSSLNVILIASIFCVAGLHRAGADDQAEIPATEQQPSAQVPARAVMPPGFIKQAPSGSPHSFQPANVDTATVRASMKARAEYDALNREITARRQKLYEDNPTIQKLQSNMRELQKKIDEILAADEELLKLKAQFEAISPQSPFGIDRQHPQLPSPAASKENDPKE